MGQTDRLLFFLGCLTLCTRGMVLSVPRSCSPWSTGISKPKHSLLFLHSYSVVFSPGYFSLLDLDSYVVSVFSHLVTLAC